MCTESKQLSSEDLKAAEHLLILTFTNINRRITTATSIIF